MAKTLTIKDLGYDSFFKSQAEENKDNTLIVGRVIRMNKRYYTVLTDNGEFLSTIKGKIRHSSSIKSELPVVGDFVFLKTGDSNRALIDRVLQRKNTLYRKSGGAKTDIQVLVSNIDYAFILVSIDTDASISMIGRYLSMVHASHIKPIIAISKIDLYEESVYKEMLKSIKDSFKDEDIFAYSAKSGENCDKFLKYIKKTTSSVFIGYSGSGKSTIINYLLKEDKMKTKEVREYDYKGMHTTTHRELFFISSGGVVIDTPGLRSLGVWEDDKGIKKTFNDLEDMAKNCKFNNCTHQHEPGCYILEMLENNKIDYERYSAYINLKNESRELYKNSPLEVSKSRKKAISKILKSYKKHTPKGK